MTSQNLYKLSTKNRSTNHVAQTSVEGLKEVAVSKGNFYLVTSSAIYKLQPNGKLSLYLEIKDVKQPENAVMPGEEYYLTNQVLALTEFTNVFVDGNENIILITEYDKGWIFDLRRIIINPQK